MAEDKPTTRRGRGLGTKGVALDDIDLRIIEVLQRDGRAQSTVIGEELGLTGNLVANRIRAMDAGGLMRVVALSDFRVHGYRLLAAGMRWDPIVRHDGALSVRRAFVRDDWERLLQAAGVPREAVTVRWHLPFRLCVGRRR